MAVPYQPTYTLNPKYGFRYGPSTFGPTTTNLTSKSTVMSIAITTADVGLSEFNSVAVGATYPYTYGIKVLQSGASDKNLNVFTIIGHQDYN